MIQKYKPQNSREARPLETYENQKPKTRNCKKNEQKGKRI
jgi:hypothetical protein